MPLLVKFVQLYFQLPFEQLQRILRVDFENLLHIGEPWFAVPNDTGVGVIGHLAIGESIQRIDGLVG